MRAPAENDAPVLLDDDADRYLGVDIVDAPADAADVALAPGGEARL